MSTGMMAQGIGHYAGTPTPCCSAYRGEASYVGARGGKTATAQRQPQTFAPTGHPKKICPHASTRPGADQYKAAPHLSVLHRNSTQTNNNHRTPLLIHHH
nr:unnamed protein product [Digitaria exilis]